jgi:Dolichyl-phosphate-mannose-protein mannosyltransferase
VPSARSLPDAAPAVSSPPRARAALVACLAVAFLLRVAGLTYGLPRVYHSDTPKQLHWVTAFMRGDLVPGETYPMLHMYLVAFLLRVVGLVDPHAFDAGPSWSQALVTARLLNAALGTATVWLLYDAARRLFGWRVGLLGAALLALSTPAIVNAHYEMGDVPQTFFVVAALAASTRALVGGRLLALLATGVLAGLAAAAKFFGVVVASTAVIAALGARRWSPAQGGLLLAGVGLGVLAGFSLSTPLLLLKPGRWIRQVQSSPELFLDPPPPPLDRLWVGSRVVLGLALLWFGLPLCLTTLAGIVALARRGWRGALVLATPTMVLGIYVWFRPKGLDDRYLVILAPFVALAAALAGSRLAHWSRRVDVLAALALIGIVALDAANVTYLLRTEDTQQAALRWSQRHMPPDVAMVRLPAGDPRAIGAQILVTDTQTDDRLHVWYSSQQNPAKAQAMATLEAEGKLLRRFELLPRGFVAPTIRYYDLESAGVPHAFPPPDDAASDEAVVFVDPDAVPDRTAVVVTPGHPRTWTLVSRTPLPRLMLALSGEGRLRVRWGRQTRRWRVDPRHPTLVEIEPARGFPWFKPIYRVGLRAVEGRIAVRFLRTPCDVAEQLLARKEWAAAATRLEACRGTRWREPARLLDLAWARARAGEQDRARAALSELAPVAPGLFEGLADLASQPDDDAWRARYATLVGRGRFTWYGHTFPVEPEVSPARLGVVVDDPTASRGQFVRALPGVTPAGYLKVWLAEHFLRGRFHATFRVRGAPGAPGPVATLEVVRHFPGGGFDLVAVRDWAPRSGAWNDIRVPFATNIEPVTLELRVQYHGRGTLDVDRMTVVPDIRTDLMARLAILAPLAPRAAEGRGAPGQTARLATPAR